MKRALCILGWTAVALCGPVCGQTTAPNSTDVMGMHNMTAASGSGVSTAGGLGCTFCHAPHSGGTSQLWNQKLSSATYTPYTSSTYQETGSSQPTLGYASSLCLSCHDGTVAVGQSPVYGNIPTQGTMLPVDVLGTNLSGSHPFSLVLPLKDAPDLVSTLVSNGTTADKTGALTLINGNVECTSCHNAHVQGIDPVAQKFLVINSANGQMCLACHDPNRQPSTGQINRLSGWTGSIHATATNQVSSSANVGVYQTVATNACTSCHMEHNANGPARLLRPATPATPGVDVATQDCITCHSGAPSTISPLAPNIYGEFTKIGHLLPTGVNQHDEAESPLLNNNRHATCVDCHSPHAALQLTVFSAPPLIRAPQTDAIGVSGVDGTTSVIPAVNQYETCLRCHGRSSGKQTLSKYGYLPIRVVAPPDPLNLVAQFSITSTSNHPVISPATNSLPQPSLLTNMLTLNGTPSSRVMSAQIFCTDCHNSDDNREFGGTGPNGPHGSKWLHILERRYEFSQAPAPGQLINNLYPYPDLSFAGPYALCGKCHDLANQIIQNISWQWHSLHINGGFSCSTCHTAHGMGGLNPNISGQRLINFDARVVAPNGAIPVTYNRGANNTCILVCHQVAHNANGSVTAVGARPAISHP